MAETLRHRYQIPRHDSTLEAIRLALFSFFGIPNGKEPTDDQVANSISKSSFAKSKIPMDDIWKIEKDATRRIAQRKAKK